jgi:hypothetical protein
MARSSTFPFPRTEFGEARSHLMPTEMMAINRSSTATALVSGLAAMLMTILSSDTGKAWHPAARHGRHEQINKIRNAARYTTDRKYAQVWDLSDGYTRDSHSEGGKWRALEDGRLDSVKGQVVVDVNAPQEERKDAIALFESHLACIAVVR